MFCFPSRWSFPFRPVLQVDALQPFRELAKAYLRTLYLIGIYAKRAQFLSQCFSLGESPTSHMLKVYPFDDVDIRGQGILLRIGRLIEVEVFIHCTHLPMQEPGEHLYEIMDERGMNRGFPIKSSSVGWKS